MPGRLLYNNPVLGIILILYVDRYPVYGFAPKCERPAMIKSFNNFLVEVQ